MGGRVRLLDSDTSYRYRKYKNSEKCSVYAINPQHGGFRSERFLGIAPTPYDAQRCVDILAKAHEALIRAQEILK
jgi:hypothetical protein